MCLLASVNCADCPFRIKYISDANSTTKMADMNNTIDINQAENEILLSLNDTLIPTNLISVAPEVRLLKRN